MPVFTLTHFFVMSGTMLVSRMLAPVVSDGWKKLTKAEEKEEQKRIKHLKDDLEAKLKLQRSSHQDRLNEANNAHDSSLQLWRSQKYYERCWPLRNPFDMQICMPISDMPISDEESLKQLIVPCRLISALKDTDHPYAKTINGNLSSFIVNHYQTNSIHAVVSEIGAWKDEIQNNDASVNYLYTYLKKQPVMVLAPTLIDDGKTFIFKAWSWGLGENLNYPAGFELGRLHLKPLYAQITYEETLNMIQLGKELNQDYKFFSQKLQHNIAIIKEIKDKNLQGASRERMMMFLTPAPETDEIVKARMEQNISGVFCCVAGMYADSYHLLEYKTLPKLPSLLPSIPGVELILPSLRDYYLNLLQNLELIEPDSSMLSYIYMDIARAFGRLNQNETMTRPFLEQSLRLYALSSGIVENEDLLARSIPTIADEIESNPALRSSSYVKEYKSVCNDSNVYIFEQY